MPYALGGCFIRMEIYVRFPLSAFVPSIPIYIYYYMYVWVCVCVRVGVCVWGQPLFLRDLRTTLFSVFPDVACNSKSPRAARLNEVARRSQRDHQHLWCRRPWQGPRVRDVLDVRDVSEQGPALEGPSVGSGAFVAVLLA